MRFETASGLSVERLDARGIPAIGAAAWNDLSTNALVENPFYGRDYVLAGLGTIDAGTELEALAVWKGEALAGLFPYRVKPFPFSTAEGAANLYQPNSTPLILAELAEPVLSAFLDASLDGKGVPRHWLLKNVDLGSALMPPLEAALAKRSLRLVAVNRYRRPRLTRAVHGLDGHVEALPSKGRFKDIKRNLRRLKEKGTLRYERTTEPALLDLRLEQFLALENAGWKGESGTAFLAKERHAAFARDAFAPRGGERTDLSIDTLLLDETPIAMSLNLKARDTVFTPKCAYDERHRRYCPGLVLEYLIIESFYSGGEAVDMDAATTREGHVISTLWNGWKDMGTLVLGPPDWKLWAIASFAERVYASRELAKSMLGRRPVRPEPKPVSGEVPARGDALASWAAMALGSLAAE